jgi:hypothetical protein
MEKGTNVAGKAERNDERHRQTSEGELEDEQYVASARELWVGGAFSSIGKATITGPGAP